MEGFYPVTPFCSQTGLQISELWAALWCCTGSLTSLASVSLSVKGGKLQSLPVLASQSGPLLHLFHPRPAAHHRSRSHFSAEKGLHMQKVGSRSVRAALAELVALPCLSLRPRPGATREAPRIKWTKVRTASGQRQDLPILVAKDNGSESPRAGRDVCHFPPTPGTGPTPRCSWGPLRPATRALPLPGGEGHRGG